MLPDIIAPNLKIVFCGTAKGFTSFQLGFYYAFPSNKFYSILHKAGFTPHQLAPNECYEINQFSIGLTDLVDSAAGNDKDIHITLEDVERLKTKIELFSPKIIAFTSKTAASHALGFGKKTTSIHYGLQNTKIHNTYVYVLPSTSGSARSYWNETHWIELGRVFNQL